MTDPELVPVELCVRWGEGKDRCIRHYDHLGECRDAAGNTTLSLMAEWTGRPFPPPEYDV